jgi:DNA polymerase-4
MRLRKAGVQIEVIAVGIKAHDFSYQSHQKTLLTATNITAELHRNAVELFHELWDHKTPIRHLGLHTSRVRDGGASRQLSLFDLSDSQPDFTRLEQADAMSDLVRDRYGIDALKRAAFLARPRLKHISGGILREKHTVDYTKVLVE